jgi:hypothetical protein
MTSFSARTHAEAIVLAAQEEIWAALVDPALMARLTPFLSNIRADGDHWLWEMSGLNVLGLKVAPAFTERMVFTEPHRIEFHHDPPAGADERAGVEGWYSLTPAGSATPPETGPETGPGTGPAPGPATRLVTDLQITIDLPLPKASGPAVRATMRKVLEVMGDRFSQRLLDHLGAESRSG